MTIFDILKFEIIFFYVFFQVKIFKGEIENYSLNLRPMLPFKVVIQSLNFLMMYSKTFFHCFHQKLDSIKESRVRAAHAQSYTQKTLRVLC